MSANNCKNLADSWCDPDKRLQWMEAQLRRERADLAHTSARLRHVLERLARHPRILKPHPDPGSIAGVEGFVPLCIEVSVPAYPPHGGEVDRAC